MELRARQAMNNQPISRRAALAIGGLSAVSAQAKTVRTLATERPVFRRGMTFLASEIGRSASAEEVIDFVRACQIDFVVFDLAWVTYHWPRTDLKQVDGLCRQLQSENVLTALMYRPRVLRPAEADVRLARLGDGSIAPSHNELCFSNPDSRGWGAEWGTRILSAIHHCELIVLYNLRPVCQCELCRGAVAVKQIAQFVRQCRSDWQRIRPAVQVGHVGVGGEYADDVDVLCPFLAINRFSNGTPAATPGPEQIYKLKAQHANKLFAPLLKTYWASQTQNSTEDIAGAIRTCLDRQLGFVLWYYDWLFRSADGRYDREAIVSAMDGDWKRISRYY